MNPTNKKDDAYESQQKYIFPRHYADVAVKKGGADEIKAWIKSNVPEDWQRLTWAHVKFYKRTQKRNFLGML